MCFENISVSNLLSTHFSKNKGFKKLYFNLINKINELFRLFFHCKRQKRTVCFCWSEKKAFLSKRHHISTLESRARSFPLSPSDPQAQRFEFSPHAHPNATRITYNVMWLHGFDYRNGKCFFCPVK